MIARLSSVAMTDLLPIESILEDISTPLPPGVEIGRSRAGQPLFGHRFGHGPLSVSLIAGCHADEPVGPAMLERLVGYLARQVPDDPLLSTATWHIVAHANPDGERANQRWTQFTVTSLDAKGRPSSSYDLARYLRDVKREAPGDDIEFGFPRTTNPEKDTGARPENQAIATFLANGAPIDLHASFHGMAFAAGPWFLLERNWIKRTGPLRDAVRARVRALGYRLHDIDRQGDKGFDRIDRGFTTRPDSRAMAAHFQARGDEAMASRFRPSSMELVRRLGGDALTLVSEMPLFLIPQAHYEHGNPIRPTIVDDLTHQATTSDAQTFARAVRTAGVVAMPIADQMRLQLTYLDTALQAVLAHRTSGAR